MMIRKTVRVGAYHIVRGTFWNGSVHVTYGVAAGANRIPFACFETLPAARAYCRECISADYAAAQSKGK